MDKTELKHTIEELNGLIAGRLTGEYTAKRLRQRDLAPLLGMPLVTLQRKLDGTTTILATEFVRICWAIGIDPAETLNRVERDWLKKGPVVLLDPEPVSEGAGTNELQQKRIDREAKARAELDQLADGERSAAIRDKQLDSDEPSGP